MKAKKELPLGNKIAIALLCAMMVVVFGLMVFVTWFVDKSDVETILVILMAVLTAIAMYTGKGFSPNFSRKDGDDNG